MYLRVLLKLSLKHFCFTFQSEVRLFECLARRRLDKLTNLFPLFCWHVWHACRAHSVHLSIRLKFALWRDPNSTSPHVPKFHCGALTSTNRSNALMIDVAS